MAIIPEKGINYAVYLNDRDQLGIAEIEMPNLELMTSEVKGAGVAGIVNSPVLGHINSLKMGLTWRNVCNDLIGMMPPKVLDLTLYSAQQDFDTSAGKYRVGSVKIYAKGIPVTANLGNLVVGELTGTKSELELIYIKASIDNVEKIEIDKYNYKFVIDGVDYLAEVRKALGKA